MSKRLFISTLTTLLISASAEGFAADMAVKAPPVVAPPPPAWTGFYFGGNVATTPLAVTDPSSAPMGGEKLSMNSF